MEHNDSSSCCHKRKHGGSRPKLTWQDKVELAEKDKVEAFLSSSICGCKCNCINKINQFGESGVQMVMDLRTARCART